MVRTIRQPHAGGRRAMSEPDVLLERIQSFNRARGGGVVQKAARGYSLRSERSGAPIARLRPTRDGERVQVLWWNGERWGASGPFGMATSECRKFRVWVGRLIPFRPWLV